MSVILGLNAYHADSAACIVIDGRLMVCAEEERFRRVKHWAGFPTESVRYCLSATGVDIKQRIHVAINSDPKANLGRKMIYTLSHPPGFSMLADKCQVRRKRLGIDKQLAVTFPEYRFANRLHKVEHHLSHLASAYFAGPWDEAVAVSVDGFGDFASAAWGHAINGEVTLVD